MSWLGQTAIGGAVTGAGAAFSAGYAGSTLAAGLAGPTTAGATGMMGVGATAGGALTGVYSALAAIPVAGIVQAIFREIVRWRRESIVVPGADVALPEES